MKKILKSKAVIIGLAAACIVIVGVCWFVGRKKEATFEPEGPPSQEIVSDWEENKGEVSESVASTEEESTRVIERETETVIVEFTTLPEQPEPPERPQAKGDLTNPEIRPTYENDITEESLQQEETIIAAETEEEHLEQQEPESSGQMEGVREDGVVYDEVFGWVVPSPIIQSEITSDGDPNKMIGRMD